VIRQELKQERDALLKRLARPPVIKEHKKFLHPFYKARSNYYSHIDLYTQHIDSHKYKQQFRQDKEAMLLMQIREK